MDSIIALGDKTAASKVHTHQVVHPDTKTPLEHADGVKVEVDFVGFESDEAVAANAENRRINHQRAIEGLEYSPQVEDATFYRLLAYCTKGWRGVPKAWLYGLDAEDATEPLPFSRDIAFKLYERLGWFRNQINAEMSKRKGFTQALSGG